MNPLYARDLALHTTSLRLIGVDEAGRGALAGPVVVAAVILDYSVIIEGVNDSKKLSPAMRDQLFELITNSAVKYQIIEIDNEYIDEHNILQATLQGMMEAIAAIAEAADLCLIDGNQIPAGLNCRHKHVIRGDSLHACIAAASILAKVHRDRIMVLQDALYPLYGYAKHKGYGTPQHLKALEENGPCAIHRKSFSPIREFIQNNLNDC